MANEVTRLELLRIASGRQMGPLEIIAAAKAFEKFVDGEASDKPQNKPEPEVKTQVKSDKPKILP